MDRIRIGELKVDPIKDILFIPLGMHNRKLWRIEEPAAVQPISRDKVSPLLASVTKVKPHIGRAETSVGSCDRAMWRRLPLTRSRGNVDHNACLLAEFSRGRARNNLHRLDRIERNLVGEHFALLIRDRLAIH